jgi:hypothetical protein
MNKIFNWVLTAIDALVGVFVIYSTIGPIFKGNFFMIGVLILGLVVCVRLFVADIGKALKK